MFLVQAASLARGGKPFDEISAEILVSEKKLGIEIFTKLTDSQRAILSLLAGLKNIPVPTRHLAALTGADDIDAQLKTLLNLRLVQAHSPAYSLTGALALPISQLATTVDPMIDLILAHLGSDLSANWKEHLAGIEMARRHPNVYLDTGAVVFSRYIEQAVKELGPEKIIFGSDEPEVDCRLEIFKIRVLKLPKEQEEMILGGNMLRLLSKYKGGAA